MECKQESPQTKVQTKSFRRRQRRKEAAALQKLAASVISQKIESSVELPKKLSDDFINILSENAAPDGNSKSQPSAKSITTNPNPVSVSICEKAKCEQVIQNKTSKKSKSANISLPGVGSKENKDTIAVDKCKKQCIDDKEKKSTTDSIKTDNNLSTHETLLSGKPSCSPRNLKKRNGKNPSQVSEVDLKASGSVQEIYCNCNIALVESVKDSVDGGSPLGKAEKKKDIGHGEVRGKQKDLDSAVSKKRKQKPSNKGTDTTVRKDLLIEEENIDPLLSKSTAKAANVNNTLENSKNSISEEVNRSVSFQSTDNISNTPQVHLEITLKEQPVIPEDSNKHQSDTSFVSKMDRTSEKVSDQKQDFSNKTMDVKCVPKVTDGAEGKTLVEAESKKDASDKERVKAEREARKAAKQSKKQKDKVVKENGVVEPSAENSLQNRTDEKSGELVHKNDLIPTAARESESNVSNKSKSELRAERRAKQEAQRAAKAAAVTTAEPKKISVEKTSNTPQTQQRKGPPSRVKSVKVDRKGQGAKLLNRFGLGESRSQNWKENSLLDTQSIHPAIVQLGTRFTDRIISGSNARCIAFVQAIKKAIQDYETPPQKELARDLEACLLTPSLEYLEAQRPHAVSVLNATRFLKWQLTQLQPLHDSSSEKKLVVPDEKAKHNLIEGLDSYIWEKIEVAEKAVCLTLMDKIKNGDVILTYGCSYLLQQIFIEAKKVGTMFKVVVVDGRPWKEGREMLRSLVSVGIPCSYVLLSAASSVMRQVNKVILGAHALLSNGYVMSRVGVSQVALLASAHNVPVLVACETHKFCERVQSDSFVYNEMGEPDGLSQLLGGEEGPLSGWKKLPNLSLLNLSYDVTPPELVTAVATELAVLPCTSVPVVLRVRPMEPVTCRH